MNEKPGFVQEVTEWAETLPLAGVGLLESDSGAYVLRFLSNTGAELNVNLIPLINRPSLLPDPEKLAIGAPQQIVLWEDIWHTKRTIVQSRLSALLGISQRVPARLTLVHRLNRPTTLKFLQANHLQDAVLSKFKYGLFLPRKHYRVLQNPPDTDTLLVAVATFARPRLFFRDGGAHRSYELVRFANLLNFTVVGGMDKLLSSFVKEHQPDDLMTYADLEWSDGRSYIKLGFTQMGDTPPQPFWVNSVTMERYYPHRLPLGIGQETASDMGYIPIKNAGSRKFVKAL